MQDPILKGMLFVWISKSPGPPSTVLEFMVEVPSSGHYFKSMASSLTSNRLICIGLAVATGRAFKRRGQESS